jgi:predicted dehydrogenase
MLRLGILGAAAIAPAALIAPARAMAGQVSVTAVAARSAERARAFAAKHGIARAYDGYGALIADPEIDALYNPLPNGLHGYWTIKALEAGKHVLCEKPIAANADEAQKMADAANANGRVLMEAFHYRYHPLAQRMKDIVASGELGTVREIRTAMCFPLPVFSNIRYNFALAGGATMDAGCYAIHMARLLGGGEPEVLSANAKLRDANIDRAMDVTLRFPSGAIGHVCVSMWSMKLLEISARVTGSDGEMRIFNPVMPQAYHRLTVRTAKGKRTENLGRRPSYLYQLEAFAAACAGGPKPITSAEDGIANMKVIDAAYRAAALPLRRPTLP